jgi:hypothetical protein
MGWHWAGIHLGRCLIGERLMGSHVIIERQIARQPLPSVSRGGLGVGIDRLMLGLGLFGWHLARQARRAAR